MLKKHNQYTILLFIFFGVFISHFFSENITSFDSRWSIHTAMSIIKEGNTDLDEYKGMIEKEKYYAIENIKGHYYSMFPIGASIIAVPFVYIFDAIDINVIKKHSKVELFVASFVIALAAVFIYLIARLFIDKKSSFWVSFIFAFCTPAWSTASRALWQHGPSMLMLTITLYLILLAKGKPWLIQFASIPLAFSYVVRPTNSISIFLVSLFVLIRYRQYFLRYLIWAMTIAVPFLLFNLAVYHSLLSPYYLPQRIGSNPHFFEALAGNLISPARGLFVFSPILLFSIYGIWLKFKKKQLGILDCFLLRASNKMKYFYRI